MIEALREQVIPWLHDGSARLVLAYPPSTDGVNIIFETAPLLRLPRQPKAHEVLAHWPKFNLVASRYPRLGFVLDGEADITFGITEKMARHTLAPGKLHGRYTLQLPQRSVLVLPPGIPCADGGKAHWERPHPELAHSRILWITFMTNGITLHACKTDGTMHTGCRGVFVSEGRLNPLMMLILETLEAGTANGQAIARSLLLSLILLIDSKEMAADLTTGQSSLPGLFDATGRTGSALSQADVVQRACDYIDSHLNTNLSAEDIATHAYISVSHLNRLFRAHLNTTVFTYITARRVDIAKSLLETTDYSIRDISHAVGYDHPNYLSKVFMRATGERPLAFRRNRQATPTYRNNERIVPFQRE